MKSVGAPNRSIKQTMDRTEREPFIAHFKLEMAAHYLTHSDTNIEPWFCEKQPSKRLFRNIKYIQTSWNWHSATGRVLATH